MDLAQDREAARRRAFAIISHPDAGKTTLTEKLLLYARAIHLAGSVKSRKASKHALSDWMAIEKERGISVTSSVLQFEHQGKVLNLLDTPGHADFSEDTYRVLAAVDSAVMLMDHSKGVEARTKKLFEVCRLRKVPVITFMNKLDRAGLEPLALVDDVSQQLNLKVAPLNWPIGMGREFRGVIDLATKDVLLFEAEAHGTQVIEAKRVSFEEAKTLVEPHLMARAEEELELVAMAGEQWSVEGFLSGDLSPCFWGSAMTNFGVEPLLEFLALQAAPPGPRATEDGTVIQPKDERFSGFIFKIQANMNPKHRDRIAFLRVVSGHFERDMDVVIGRNQQTMRMANPHSFMAQERSLLESAYPGDIVGIHDPGKLRVGDTLAAGGPMRFAGIPRFAPEHFGMLRLSDPLKRKAMDTGIEQLAHEGVIQLFYRIGVDRTNPYLGAVGLLQFEVLKERLKHEYGVEAKFEALPFKLARWIGGAPEALTWLKGSSSFTVMEDRNGHPVLLCDSDWWINYAKQNAKGVELYDIEPL
ncbi:MAG: peptide chain release factor 3 [Deltaproteobacteria bacterium]|jgi:peptide chain release factor 3|nr:peptide chain release factor 3 [Deltaproteobacteria bacterium]